MNRATRWSPLLEVTVGHAYFADGLAQGLSLEPSADTVEWLRAHDCVTRQRGSGFLVAAPGGAALDASVSLAWCVRSQDTGLHACTEGLATAPGELLVLRPGSAADDPLRLHAGPVAGPADHWPATWPSVTKHLSVSNRRHMPLMLLDLPVPERPVHYRAQLAARATVWRYWLLGDWSEDPLQVVDPTQQIRFTDPQPEQLVDGRMVLSSRSESGIELRQRSDERFQLRSRSAAAERVLVKRLPVAGADHFARETIHGVPALVSEIYVHR